MSRLSKALTLGLLTGLVGLMVTLVPWGLHLEETLGLELLFRMRGARQAPVEVMIVGIDRASSVRLKQLYNPRKWPRSLHARLTEVLAQVGAAVTVFDVIFDEAQAAADDEAFASAIRTANNVVLFEYLDGETMPVTGKERSALGGVHLEKRIPPIPVLARAARASAPFPLPKIPVKVSQYWTFKTGASDTPTLPVVAFQIFALEVYDTFFGLLKSVRPALAEQLPPDQAAVLTTTRTSQLVRTLRDFFQKDPLLAESMLAQLAQAITPPIEARQQQLLQSLIRMYQSQQSLYLNFYGPHGTIPIIPYHQILALAEPDSVAEPQRLALRGKAVFVGLTDQMRSGQKDDFHTVFSQQSGANIAGVEIAATAFANLVEGIPVQLVGWRGHLATILLWGLVLGLVCGLLSTVIAAVSICGLGALYLIAILGQFTTTGSWYPLVVPLGFQVPLAFFGTVLWKYFDTYKERQNMRRAFGYYLPGTVIEQLSHSVIALEANNQVVYGTCLFTDVAHFTSLSETMEPGELGSFMNAYFAAVFEPVRRHGGIVSNLIGDGMLAIWPTAQPDATQRVQACRTAIEIARAVRQVKVAADTVHLPTRIGLHFGNILLGNIGAHDHYQYTALGDIVNTASRIEGLNKHLGTQILVSAEVLYQLDGFLTRALGVFLPVGKTKPLVLHELLCRREEANKQQTKLCTVFAAALAAYTLQAWDEALEKFYAIVNSSDFKEDGPALLYIKLCEQYQASPPGKAWNGVVRMGEK